VSIAEGGTERVRRGGGKKASRWSVAVALVLAGVLLVLAFRGVSWSDLLGRLSQGRLDLLALAALTFTTSYFLRGLRWRILLGAERPAPPVTVFLAVAAGYLGNSFLPARAGELIRSALIARRTGMSTSYVLATALVERVLDVVALVLISFAAVAALPLVPAWLVGATHLMAVLALVGLFVFVALPRLDRPMKQVLARVLGPSSLQTRLSDLLQQFLLGMRAFQHVGRGAGFAGLTVVIWLADSLAILLVAHAFRLSLVLPQALVLLAALGLASAAPSTPGYVGIFQFVAVTVLAPFGFSREAALAYIIAVQAVMYVVVIVWGGLGLWALGVRPPRQKPAPTMSSAS
jgi:uncharacterized protein (TIRG00374 family)